MNNNSTEPRPYKKGAQFHGAMVSALARRDKNVIAQILASSVAMALAITGLALSTRGAILEFPQYLGAAIEPRASQTNIELAPARAVESLRNVRASSRTPAPVPPQ